MTFTPESGPWAQEDFSSQSGLMLDTYQTVAGGYLAIVPLFTGTRGFISRWTHIPSWDVNNNLNTIGIITGTFSALSGNIFSSRPARAGLEGYQRHIRAAGAYEFNTPSPDFVNYTNYVGYSGQVTQSVQLDSGSPDASWYSSYIGGMSEVTIEFDVASTLDIYSGQVTLGFQTGQEIQTTLPPLRDQLVNHGVYIDNGQFWDYLEINPFGIRSINSPEFSLPIDLRTPKRVRLGISSQNMTISTENGRGVHGLGILNSAVVTGNDAKIVFGAVPISGTNNRYPLLYNTISGVHGNTFWDNIRVLYNKYQITAATGNATYYTTSAQTGYSSIFEPEIPIINWNLGKIGFIPYTGSSNTVVVAQYSGAAGWTDGPSVTINAGRSPTTIDLTTIPVFRNSRSASTHNRVKNPLRFKIIQASNGFIPAPPIDYINFSARTEKALLDVLPNWKPVNASAKIKFAVDREVADNLLADASINSTFVLNSPLTTGTYLNALITTEDTVLEHNVLSTGYVDVVYGGFNSTAIQTFTRTMLAAQIGTPASAVLGVSPVTNCFYNSDLEGGYSNVSTFPNFVTGKSFGQLAGGLKINAQYTGLSQVYFEKLQIFKADTAASDFRQNAAQGRSQTQQLTHVQSVRVPPNTFVGSHDASCGFEVCIPSGICSGTLMFTADIQVQAGSGLYVYATGINVRGTPSWNIDGSHYRSFRRLSFPVVSHGNSGEVFVGLAVSPGTLASQEVIFNVDNIQLNPYAGGFIYSTGVPTFLHQSGLLRSSYPGVSTVPAVRSSTLVGLDISLLGYPTGDNNALISKYRESDNKGFKLYCTTGGYLAADIDIESQAWAFDSSALMPFTGSVYRTGLVSEYRLPLGRCVSVGLIHQADTYETLGYCNYSGAVFPCQLSSTNRTYLTVDGSPVGVVDMNSNWNNGSFVTNGDRSPYLSYICDGSGTVVIGSGLLAQVDSVEISRPVIADAEIDASIKMARVTRPYFVPDKYFKPTASSTIKNLIIKDEVSHVFGKDIAIGSIYNFDSPGYTNWDHGPWRNHLIYYGSVSKISDSPYDPYQVSGLSSTYIPSGSYAVAKYSSTIERLYNSNNNLGLNSLYPSAQTCNTALKVLGWVKPYTSGQDFFHVYEDDKNLLGRRVSFGFNNDMKLKVHLASGSSDLWGFTGSVSHNLTGWNWVGFYSTLGDYSGHNTTGAPSVVLVSSSGSDNLPEALNGLNFGFQYYGRSGSPSKSSMVFGGNAPVALSDFSISIPHSQDFGFSESDKTIKAPYANKSGQYTVLMEGSEPFAGNVAISGFNLLSATLSGDQVARETMYWVAAHNGYDSSCRLNGGIDLYDDEPFRHVQSYYLNYDTTPILSAIGDTLSPIRIGNQVPAGAVNLARVSSPAFTTETVITTIDLADSNLSNLLAYKGGQYALGRGLGDKNFFTSTGSFSNINTAQYTGRLDFTMSGQLYSDNITVTPIAISTLASNQSFPAYYYYLIGRGKYGISVPGADAHPTSNFNGYTTGELVTRHYSNIQKVKEAISIKDSNGLAIPFETFPYEIVTSPYEVSDLYAAIQSGVDFQADGIQRSFTTQYTDTLPTGVFSVIMMLNKQTINKDTSVWVHYPAYNFNDGSINYTKKEVVNASPLMRKNIENERALPGRYSVSLDSQSLLYSLKVFGVHNDYSGKL